MKGKIKNNVNARKNVKSSVNPNNNGNKVKRRPRGYTRQQAVYSSISRFQNKLNKTAYFKNARDRFYNYIKALYNPEDCVEGKNVAKQFSPISIPTSTVAFREQMYFTPEYGKFDMIWVPNFFTTQNSLTGKIALEPSSGSTEFYSHLYLKDNNDDGWKLHTSYAPSINLAKYRLVSAKLVIEYNGPKIQQGGSVYSCAIYNDLPVFIGIADRGDEDPFFPGQAFTTDRGLHELDQYTDIELLQNGLWNRYVNFSTTRGYHSVTAVPTDPTDSTFFPMCNYYAETPSTVRFQDPSDSQTPNKYLLSCQSSDGGHLSYILKGNNLKSDNNAPVGMMVNVYYNFEIIADQSTAPFLRGKKGFDPDVAKIYDYGKEMIAEIIRDYEAQGKKPDFKAIATRVIGDKLGLDVSQFKNTLQWLKRDSPWSGKTFNFVDSSDL
jgi:hypothetical protein